MFSILQSLIWMYQGPRGLRQGAERGQPREASRRAKPDGDHPGKASYEPHKGGTSEAELSPLPFP